MTDRERFIAYMHYKEVDRIPVQFAAIWPDTLHRWYQEGFPEGADPETYFGVYSPKIVNVGPNTSLFPGFEESVLHEDDDVKIYVDNYGRTARVYKNHTTMPEWIDYPVKTRGDLQNILEKHFNPKFMKDRFPSNWEKKVLETSHTGAIILVDGGCYYWTLRSLAGVEQASYLFYDAPDLVEELFERINIICMEAIRRTASLTKIDVIGFAEDIGFKTGTLISPAMFKKFILPRYRRVMDIAHSFGVDLALYDSDGDIRHIISDCLSCGINIFQPCEVAANMDPLQLKGQFGKSLRLMGGFDKRIVAAGKNEMDLEFTRLIPVVQQGGFALSVDHSVSADISFENYCYFMKKCKELFLL